MTAEPVQQYVVHLDIQAVALDPSDAVLDALAQVRTGELCNLAYSVEAVESGATLDTPTQHQGVDDSMHGTWGDSCYGEGNGFAGEFLG